MVSIAYIGEPLSIEEAQEKLNEAVTVDDFVSSMQGEEKELYDKLSDEEKSKYTELSFTITSVDEKDGLVEYRNGLDEQVVVIFTKTEK